MQALTTDLVSQACRIFLALAYPGDDSAIPANRRQFRQLTAGMAMLDFLAAHDEARECVQVVRNKNGAFRMLLMRLGCQHYPNLKLKAQLIGDDERNLEWLFAVETHDGFSATSFLPPPVHPEAPDWERLQAANVAMKEMIEAAWDAAGLLTFNGLLRRDLPKTQMSM